MINSFGTGKPTEADGSGRGTGKRTEAVAAVRLFGCSAVRAVRAAAALLPRMASGERSEAPTEAGATATAATADSSSLFFCGCRLSAAAAGSHPPADGKIHRCAGGCDGGCAGGCDGGCAGGGSPPPNGQRRAERSPHRSRSNSSRVQQLSFSCAIVFAAVAFISSGEGSPPPPNGQRRAERSPHRSR